MRGGGVMLEADLRRFADEVQAAKVSCAVCRLPPEVVATVDAAEGIATMTIWTWLRERHQVSFSYPTLRRHQRFCRRKGKGTAS